VFSSWTSNLRVRANEDAEVEASIGAKARIDGQDQVWRLSGAFFFEEEGL